MNYKRTTYAIYALAGLSIGLLVLIIATILRDRPDTRPSPMQGGLSRAGFTEFKVERPCYKYSVRMCGQWTAEPGQTAQYATEDGRYYTSYKKDGRVYWTKEPVTVHKGELLWVSGQRIVRARCGNELRKQRPAGAVPVDTQVTTLDETIQEPAGPTLYNTSVPNTGTDVLETGTQGTQDSGGGPIFGAPTGGGPVGGCYGCGQVVKTPEPDSWELALLGGGLMVVAMLTKRNGRG